MFADGLEIGSLLRIRDLFVHATLSALFGVFPLASLTVLMLSVRGTKPIIIHVGSRMRKRSPIMARVGWNGLLPARMGLWILISGVGSVSAQTIVGGTASGVWTLEGRPYLFAGFAVVQDESVRSIFHVGL